MFFLPLCAEAQTVASISLADTTEWGSIRMYRVDGWTYRPDTLSQPQPVNLNEIDLLRQRSDWSGYAWFENRIEVDSTVASKPWLLSYYSAGGATLWLNGKVVYQSGKPSMNPEEEILARFFYPAQTVIQLKPGLNTIRIEFSEHTVNHRFAGNMPNVVPSRIDLVLVKPIFGAQRRLRAVIFGGSMMVLLTLILLHGFLSLQFKNEYHTSVMLTITFIAVHAFSGLSDSAFDWTFGFAPYYEITYATAFIFVIYFFSISIRLFFRLPIPKTVLTSLLIASFLAAMVSIWNDRVYLNVLHTMLGIATLGYGFHSMREAKKASKHNEIGIIAGGFAVTMLGAILYAGVYLGMGVTNDFLLISSALMAYTGIPIALTFNIAKSYAGLFKTMELKVVERTAQLQQANEYKTRFFANISHEFRTPLTIARGLLDRLSMRRTTDIELQAELGPVQRNLSRLGDMVNQIVDLTKSDHDQMALNRKHYRIDSIVTLSIESFRSLSEQRRQNLWFESATPNAIVFADRLKLEIMINNLVSNAIKFTPEAGTIRVSTTMENGHFIMTVEDSGRGIPADERDAIFERFHRIRQNDTEYVEGMGIGLELSRTLARLHGGDIRLLDSEPGFGSTFELSIPLSDAADGEDILRDFATDFHSLSPRLQSLTGDRILVVEDNDDMAAYILDVLRDVGQVERAIHGEDALAKLDAYKPELIITDLMMPRMGGAALIDALRKRDEWHDVPVVVLTAKALESDKLDLLRIGVVDYITKPFSVDELLYKSRTLLSLSKKRKKARIVLSADEASLDRERLTPKAAEWVKANIRDQSLSVDTLADQMNMSRRTLYRLIEAETGMSSAEFIREIRLQAARNLLHNSSTATLDAIAEAVGYANGRNFRKLYQERFGVHPLDELKTGG